MRGVALGPPRRMGLSSKQRQEEEACWLSGPEIHQPVGAEGWQGGMQENNQVSGRTRLTVKGPACRLGGRVLILEATQGGHREHSALAYKSLAPEHSFDLTSRLTSPVISSCMRWGY